MARILCTFPGRFGDLIWALPAIRALAEHHQQPVDLQICGEFASILPLLGEGRQPYLGRVVVDHQWGTSAGWMPPAVLPDYDHVFHLGYRGWPQWGLPFEVQAQLHQQWSDGWGAQPTIDLTRPWITVEPWVETYNVTLGWSDCWFELKVGLSTLLARHTWPDGVYAFTLAAPGSRWVTERGAGAVDWLEAARRIAASQLFVGDCSALHVLAVALGKPVILMEPMTARHNPIFYPLGQDGPQVTLVKGLDGQPTFDARHVAEAIEKALAAHV